MAKQAATAKSAASTGRGKGAAGKAPKPKKVRFEKSKQIVQAYKVIKPSDPKLPWWMLGAGVLSAGVIYLIAYFAFADNWWLPLIVAVPFGILGALAIFSYRARRTTFTQMEGRPGAAAWAVQNLRGDWRVTEAVAGNAQSDLVHRVIGRPGIVLIAEGSPQRVKSLVAQEKKRLARVVGDTPIYDVTIGDADGQVPLKKLDKHVQKLPRNIQSPQIRALDKRLKAVGAPKMPVPQGPLPKGKQMAVNSRALRRRG